MWIKSRNKALDKKRRKGQLPAWCSGLGFHQQNLLLGVQSEPKAQPCSPRLECHCQAGVRPQVRSKGKKSQWQSKLITQPDSKQTVHDLFHESKGPAALLRGKQQERGCMGMQMLLPPASLLTFPHCIPLGPTSAHAVHWYQGLVLFCAGRQMQSRIIKVLLSGSLWGCSVSACPTDSCLEGRWTMPSTNRPKKAARPPCLFQTDV